MRCVEKIRYSSRAEAEGEAARLRGLNIHRVTSYLCNVCKYWHVGKRSRGAGRKSNRQET